MKHQKTFALIGAVTLAAVAFIAVRKILSENPSDVSGVTTTNKSGGITTTPIKLGKVAFVAASSTLDTLASVPARAFDVLRNLTIPARTNVLQVQGNKESAAASYDTNRNQSAANYAPSSYAILNG